MPSRPQRSQWRTRNELSTLRQGPQNQHEGPQHPQELRFLRTMRELSVLPQETCVFHKPLAHKGLQHPGCALQGHGSRKTPIPDSIRHRFGVCPAGRL